MAGSTLTWYNPTQDKTGWGGMGTLGQDVQIKEMYKDLLGRDADQAGLDFYLNSGKSIADIAKDLVSSQEYTSKNPTTNLADIYKNVLERDPDRQGFAHYVKASGTQSLADIVGSFYDSGEYLTGRDAYTAASGTPVEQLNNAGQQNLANSEYFSNTLKGYYEDPSKFQKNPAYEVMYKQGLDAINRTAAAKGMLGSGNRLFELSQFGADNASKAWDSEANRLGSLATGYNSMANNSYGMAGNLYGIQNSVAGNNFNNYLKALQTGITAGSGSFGNDMGYLGNLAGVGNTSTGIGAIGSTNMVNSILQNLAAMLGGSQLKG